MPIAKKHQNNRKQDKELIKSKLISAGIKVHSGKKVPKNGEYSGIIGNNQKVLELNI